VLYAGMGRDGEAEPLYKRALEARERILGPEHRRTLASANNLAEFYRVRGRYGEAEPLYKRTLEASARVLGPEHPQTLASTDNLMAAGSSAETDPHSNP
jgi:Tetratricopeptide repeat